MMTKISKILLMNFLLIMFLLGAPSRPKVGLALSGGGSLGFAHIGFLEKIDSLGIPIDYIAGTSMGGLISALYSIGYDSKDLLDLTYSTNWAALFSDTPKRSELPIFEKEDEHKYQFEMGMHNRSSNQLGMISGQQVELFIGNITHQYSTITDFDKLPIPYRCIAVDLISGNEVVLGKGSLAKAMRSTMSIPSAFEPIEWGDSLLIDGGILNNLPVDVIKQMGADIIIGISVSNPNKSKEELKTIVDILSQSYNIARNTKIQKNAKIADFYIDCMLKDLSAGDLEQEKIHAIINKGRETANKNIDIFLKLKELTNVKHIKSESNIISIDSIQIDGNISYSDTFIVNKLHVNKQNIKEDSLIIELDYLKQQLKLHSITYNIVLQPNLKNKLIINLREGKKPRIFGLKIKGNKNLSFDFIYTLLGLKPGGKFDLEKLESRINYLYNLGYFKKITYQIKPASEGYINLELNVIEYPQQKLRFGFRYDNRYQFILATSGLANNLLLSGLRGVDEIQLLGLTKISTKIYYPSRTLDIPVYPYIKFNYQDIPDFFYSLKGEKEIEFNNISTSFSIGLGGTYKNWEHAELDFTKESVKINPEILPWAPLENSKTEGDIYKICFTYNMDMLDNYLYPKNGALVKGKVEKSDDSFGSFVNYSLYEVSGDFYYTAFSNHCFHLHGYHCNTSTPPFFKLFRIGGPDSFIGLEDSQLMADRMNYLKFSYNCEVIKNFQLSILYNYAFDFSCKTTLITENLNTEMSAWGLGTKYMTPIGPIQMIYAKNISNITNKLNGAQFLYFSAGYKF